MTVQSTLRDRQHIVGARRPPADPFEAIGTMLRFKAGEEIHGQDEGADLLYRVVRGSVRTTRLLDDGRRQVGGFYFAGDFFGLEIGAVHRCSAEALESAEIMVVKRSTLKHQGEDSARLERMVWLATGLELERAQDHMMLLTRKHALERVTAFLFDIAARAGGVWVHLSMSRQDIADYLGLTIETVSRMVSQMQADGLLAFDGARRFRVVQPRQRLRLVAA
ncbi:helix-turn-helix domain-containing protein [soil metagenome]